MQCQSSRGADPALVQSQGHWHWLCFRAVFIPQLRALWQCTHLNALGLVQTLLDEGGVTNLES